MPEPTRENVPRDGCLDRACDCVQAEVARLREENKCMREALRGISAIMDWPGIR
jgi:hypothetical protein